jgi:hypothetical protein
MEFCKTHPNLGLIADEYFPTSDCDSNTSRCAKIQIGLDSTEDRVGMPFDFDNHIAPSRLILMMRSFKLTSGSSQITPTWRASCRCFTTTPTEGYPRGGEFVGRVSLRSETRRCKEHKV